jgi:hypothetical protein
MEQANIIGRLISLNRLIPLEASIIEQANIIEMFQTKF